MKIKMDKVIEIAKSVAKRFGFSSVNVGFRQKAQIASIRFSGGVPSFSFARGVEKYPEKILTALIFTMLCRLKKLTSNSEYKTQHTLLMKFLQDKANVELQAIILAKRSRCYSQGTTYDLAIQMKGVALEFKDLFQEFFVNSDILVTWSKRKTHKRFGLWHPQSRIIEVSKTLDSPLVPKYVLDFILYHEMLHAARSPKKKNRHHDMQFRMLEKEYPQYTEANEFLKKIHMNKGLLPA